MSVNIENLLVQGYNFSHVFNSPVFSSKDRKRGLEFLQARIIDAATKAAEKEAESVMSKWRMKVKNSRRKKAFHSLTKDYRPKHMLWVAKEMTGLSTDELVRLSN